MDQGSNTSLSQARAMSSSASPYHIASDHDAPRVISAHSQHLQDLLRKRKAESSRAEKTERRQSLQRGRDDSIFDEDLDESIPRSNRLYDSSPVRQQSGSNVQATQHHRRVSEAGHVRQRAPSMAKAMGARELDQHLDKLTKQNFDLKLEIFHRREQIKALETKLEATKQLEQENQDLQDRNETLCVQLVQKSRSLEEAVDMIWTLEENLEREIEKRKRMEDPMAETRPSTAPQDSAYFSGENAGTISPSSHPRIHLRETKTQSPGKGPAHLGVSPVVSSRLVNLGSPQKHFIKSSRRMPSLLSEQNDSSTALRTAYVDGERRLQSTTSFATLASGRDEDGNALDDVLNSPRLSVLSVLSETSLWSMYGREKSVDSGSEGEENKLEENNDGDNTLPLVDEDSPKKRRVARLNRWIEDRPSSLSKPSNPFRAISASTGGLQSPDDVLGDRLHLTRGLPAHNDSTEHNGSAFMTGNHATKGKVTTPTLGGPIFGNDLLPPTPDTMSTHTQALNRSRSSIVENTNLNDHMPQPGKSFQSMIPVRPSSAGRPQTSLSMEMGQREYSQDEAYDDLESSDGEYETTRLQQDYGIRPLVDYPSRESISKGTPGQYLGSIGQHLVGNLMSNGETINDIQSSHTAQHKLQRHPNFVRRDSSGNPRQVSARQISTSAASQSNATITPSPLGDAGHPTSAVAARRRLSLGRQRYGIDTANSKLPRSSFRLRVPTPGSGGQPKRNSLTQQIFRRSGSSPDGDLQRIGSIDAQANGQSLGRSHSMRTGRSNGAINGIAPPLYDEMHGIAASHDSADAYRQLPTTASDDARFSSASTSRMLTPSTEISSNRSEGRNSNRSVSSSTLNAPPVSLNTQHPAQRALTPGSMSRYSEGAGTVDSGSSRGSGRKWSLGAIGVIGERIVRRASVRRNRSQSREPGGGDGRA